MKTETLENAFYTKYPKYWRVLSLYEEANGELPTWENLTKASLTKFVSYLQSKVARSSARTYCAMFKSVVNNFSDQITLPQGWDKALAVKKDISQHIYLTEEELQRIVNYTPSTETEAAVQQQFIVAALTGARHSDAVEFSGSNIMNGNLVYVSKKTHVKAEVPLALVVADILGMEKGRFSLSEYTGAFRRELSVVTFNETIREIARKCNINSEISLYRRGEFTAGRKWEYISSHTARRTAATLLYLRSHNIYLVSRLMGHSSITQTETYICCTIEDMPDSVKDYFTIFT